LAVESLYSYSQNSTHHLDIKEQICRLLAEKWRCPKLWSATQPVMKKHPEFALDFLDYLHVLKTTKPAPQAAASNRPGNGASTPKHGPAKLPEPLRVTVGNAWKLRQQTRSK
jgi:hypothetical protein